MKTAELELANLNRAILFNANLLGAHLFGVSVQEAWLHGADLSTALDLTQHQLNSANGDEKTKMPEGLARPQHWTR